jgi:hypothetical protein
LARTHRRIDDFGVSIRLGVAESASRNMAGRARPHAGPPGSSRISS